MTIRVKLMMGGEKLFVDNKAHDERREAHIR
jgi:hypothetical protein